MPRKRNLSPNFFKNEALSEIDPLGRLLFQGLWCFADRNGNLEYRPKRLKVEILPYDATVEDVTTWLQQLASNLLISFYQVGSDQYIHVNNFVKYQSPHPDEKQLFPEMDKAAEPKPIGADDDDNLDDQQEQVEAETLQPQQDTPATCQQLASNLEASSQQSFNLYSCNSNLLSQKKDLSSKDSTAQLVEEIFNHWKTVLSHPRSVLDAKRKRLITTRLKEGLTVDRAKAAIDGCRASPFHMGQNDQSTVYDGIELIFRDMAHVERFESKLNRENYAGNNRTSPIGDAVNQLKSARVIGG